MADHDPGLVGGRYRLGRRLGTGGMGVVWEGEDTVLQRPVAVKAVDLPSHLTDDDRHSLRSRVLREARSAARINHPATVRVFDVVDDGGRLYVVMELVRAPTLAEVVEERGPLSVPEVATLGLGVLGALEAAHQAGIVHRDVKPGNVMMLEDGGVKLADFGIASVKDDTRITSAGLVLGTPSYMAPEQATGQPTEAPADLWGLGALLYYSVEGVPPFDRGEALPTLNAVLHDAPRPMERADGLEPTVTALLDKDPARRLSVAQAREALEEVADRRAAAPTTVAAPASATAVLPAQQPPPPPERRAAPPPPPPRPAPRPDKSGWGWLGALAAVIVLVALAAVALANAGDNGAEEAAPGPETTAAAPDDTTAELEAPPETEASAEPTTTTAPEPTSDTRSDVRRPDGVPGDWVAYRDRATGYTVWHPPSWAPRSGPGRATDFRDSSGDYLRVDYVRPPGDDPVADWERSSASFAQRYDDYEEIRIEPTQYQGFEAALWEYTYQGQHATNLGFVTGDYGFALNFQTAADRWDERQDVRRAFEAGFRPPG
ncbi:MAG TPA: serine/threonine-protein kinase [Acidimicrobiales bacterium]|nr:serine/threonine-protein kinase [Acidimicrobiales bacterium]